MVGDHFDWSSEPSMPRGGRSAGKRPFLGVRFACCGVYARVYMNRTGSHYIGYCPRCARRVTFRIGLQGTPHRFFTAY
ncbi:MAG: hypothetical protein ACODAD_09645 [Planctomycetota bacterium]